MTKLAGGHWRKEYRSERKICRETTQKSNGISPPSAKKKGRSCPELPKRGQKLAEKCRNIHQDTQANMVEGFAFYYGIDGVKNA
jgi:hypothetical protein